jgi:replicative DNA helicase
MTTQRQATPDRLPPFSEEAERGVLGCLILNPKEGLGKAMEVIGTDGMEFYLPGHRTVWRGLLALDKAGMAIDSVTLYQWLSDAKELEAAGGMEGLMGLTTTVPGASFLESYLQIVGDKARLRRLIATCTAAVAEAFEATEDPAATTKVIERAQAAVLDGGLQTGEQAVVPMRALTQQFMEAVEFSVKHRNLGLIHGTIGSGFGYFDKKTCGFEPQTVTVISGRPSTGKTSWLCSMVLNVAVKQNIPVVFMSLEMSRKAIVERLACIYSRVNLKQLHQGMLTQQDFQRLSQALPTLARAPIWIDDGPGMTSDRLRTRTRQLVLQHEARLVVVDHLHEIRHPSARGDAGMEAREATEALRWIAKSL